MELIFRGINFREFVIFKEFCGTNFREFEAKSHIFSRKYTLIESIMQAVLSYSKVEHNEL